MSTFRAPGSTRPRSKILSGVGLVLALLASLVAFSSSPVDAIVQDGGNGDRCYETQYKKWVVDQEEESHTEYKYVKEVRGKVQYKDGWKWKDSDRYGPFDWEVWKGNSTQWSEQNVAVLESGSHSSVQEEWQEWVGYSLVTYRKLTTEYRYVPMLDDQGDQITKTVVTQKEEGHWEYGWFEEDPGDPWIETEVTREVDCEVAPEDPEVTLSKECEVPDKLHVPNTEGVIYLLDGAGEDLSGETLAGPQSGTLTAQAKDGYKLAEEWSYPFDLGVGDPCPEEVEPAAPEVNQSEQCEVEGALVIPDTGGVVYLLDTGDGPEAVSGELSGPISGTLSVEAAEGHVLVGDDAFPMEIDIAAAEDCPPPPPPPEDDPVTSASVAYECDADGSVTFSSADGASDFVVEVNGSVVYDQALEGEETLPLTIEGTTSVIVRADGVVLVNEDVVFEACDDGEVGGIGEEAPEEETVVEGTDEEPTASAPASLPRTGISAGILAMVAALTMGFGATLRAASRRLR